MVGRVLSRASSLTHKAMRSLTHNERSAGREAGGRVCLLDTNCGGYNQSSFSPTAVVTVCVCVYVYGRS